MNETEQIEFNVDIENPSAQDAETPGKKVARKATRKAAKKATRKADGKAARKDVAPASLGSESGADDVREDAANPVTKPSTTTGDTALTVTDTAAAEAARRETPAATSKATAAVNEVEPVTKEELPEPKGGVYSFSPDDEYEPPLEDELSHSRQGDSRDYARTASDAGAASDARGAAEREPRRSESDSAGKSTYNADIDYHKERRSKPGKQRFDKPHPLGGNQQKAPGGSHRPENKHQGQENRHPGQENKHQSQGGKNKSFNNKKKHQQPSKKNNFSNKKQGRYGQSPDDASQPLSVGELLSDEIFYNIEELNALAQENGESGKPPVKLNEYLEKPLKEIIELATELGVSWAGAAVRHNIIDALIEHYYQERVAVEVEGVLEITPEEFGMITYRHDNYRIKSQGAFVHPHLIETFGLKRGHILRAQIHPRDPEGSETCPAVIKVLEVMEKQAGGDAYQVDPFEELIPYYPLERILLETNNEVKWDNLSMRVVDLLTPIGLGQRGLIVAPPRTGKTVLLQGIANSIMLNKPQAHLIVLLIDERPEEVTDFKRQIHHGEVISSTFDEDAESHVHCAEMVIEKSRRMVEAGRDVIILLDSITRLARAYNTIMPSSGKILSGGVEANALQKPKRFFGSARNIEEDGGGSLTILATALVDTGSRMDEVIFEEFKGTGNMEIHLDRTLVDKRIFPAINLEKSGTRKEELLYHPDEMNKIYSLRRAMKGVPSTEAMEMLINRVKKTRSNAEFLMGLNR